MSPSSYKGPLQNAFLSEEFDSKHRNMQLKMVYTWGFVISLGKGSMGSQVQEGFQGQLCDSSRTWALSTFPLPVSAYREPLRTSRGRHGPTAPAGRGQTSSIPTPPQTLLCDWKGAPLLQQLRGKGAPSEGSGRAGLPGRRRVSAVTSAPRVRCHLCQSPGRYRGACLISKLWKSLLWGLPFQGRNPALNPGP